MRKLFLGTLLVLTSGAVLGACKPYFRRSAPQSLFASFREIWGASQRSGTSGMAANEGSPLALFPNFFPKATFNGATTTSGDHRVTIAGLGRLGSRWTNFVQLNPETGSTVTGFGVAGTQLFDPLNLQLFGSNPELHSIRYAEGTDFVYVLVTDVDSSCYVSRHRVSNGARDPTFLVFWKSCGARLESKAALAVNATELVIVTQPTKEEFRLRKYNLSTGLEITSFRNDGTINTQPLPPALHMMYRIAGITLNSSGTVTVAANQNTSSSQFLLFKVGPYGLLDASFGSLGFVVSTCTSACEVQDVVLLPDSKYWLPGRQGSNASLFVVSASNTSGDPDSTYSFPSISGNAFLSRIAADPVTPTLIHGVGVLVSSGTPKPFHLRFDSTAGTLDTAPSSYSGAGFREVSPSPYFSTDAEYPLALQAFQDGSNSRVAIATVAHTNSKDAKLRTVLIDGNTTGGDLMVGTTRDTSGMLVNNERTYPIRDLVLSDGSVLSISRRVRSGSDHPQNDSVMSEKSDILILKRGPTGMLDLTFNGSGSLLIPEDVIDGCRGATEAVAHDPVAGRFYLACMNQSTVPRADEKAFRVYAFHKNGSPVSTFNMGAPGQALVDTRDFKMGPADVFSTANLTSGLALAAIPAGSALLGPPTSGPGVAVGFNIWGTDGVTSQRFPHVMVLREDGSGSDVFGTLARVQPIPEDTYVQTLAFTPNRKGNGTGEGLWVGFGGREEFGFVRAALLSEVGVTLFNRNLSIDFPTAQAVEAIAVRPLTGRAILTVRGGTSAAVVGLDPSTFASFFSSDLLSIPALASSAFHSLQLIYHPADFFVLAGAAVDPAVIDSSEVYSPTQDGMRVFLAKIQPSGAFEHSDFLLRDPGSWPHSLGLAVGTGGHVQLSTLQTDPVAGAVHRTARIGGLPGFVQ